MRIAIFGSRQFRHLDEVRDFVRAIEHGDTVATDGEGSVGEIVRAMCAYQHIEAVVVPALWGAYSRKAMVMRDRQILEMSDRVVVFTTAKDESMKVVIELARNSGKPLILKEHD
jgi:hypothetical protein